MIRNLIYWKSRIEDLRGLVDAETVHPLNRKIYQRTLELARRKANECELELFVECN